MCYVFLRNLILCIGQAYAIFEQIRDPTPSLVYHPIFDRICYFNTRRLIKNESQVYTKHAYKRDTIFRHQYLRIEVDIIEYLFSTCNNSRVRVVYNARSV